MGISKTSDHIQIKIKMPNPSQEPPASSKAPNQDLNDMDVLCTLKIKIESQNLENSSIQKSGHIQIKVNISNSSQKPPLASQYQSKDLKDLYFLCTFKIKIESQNLENRRIKDQ